MEPLSMEQKPRQRYGGNGCCFNITM